MQEEQKIQIMNEIKQIERELYLKKSLLASVESSSDDYKVGPEVWKQRFAQCIEEIRLLSTGGNSVEDIARERQR